MIGPAGFMQAPKEMDVSRERTDAFYAGKDAKLKKKKLETGLKKFIPFSDEYNDYIDGYHSK